MDRPSSHSQRVPYARKEGRKSLFSKVKDSMSGMLSPSWLTHLVHNVKKESPTEEGNVQKGSDQSPGMQPVTSDSSPSLTPVLPQGQVGMMESSSQQVGMQFKNRGNFVGNGQPRTLDFAGIGQGINPMASPFQQGTFPPPISEFTSAQLPLARVTEKSDSIMAQEDTMSQRSDGSKSTSGCSSMIQQTDIPQRPVTGGDKRKAPTLGGSPPQEQVSKRQRLNAGNSNQIFNRRLSDTSISKPSAPSVTNRPAFNTSLFGSPFNNESSLLGTSIHESSFYPGKTKFGGRSSFSFRSQRKNADLNQSLPSRLSVPVKAFMKARPRLTPNKEAVTSSTAKRILEALDKMPTPLNDAKKIPMMPRQWTESPSFFSRELNRSAARSGPPTQKLNISSQASISRNRQVSFAPLQQPKASTSQHQEEEQVVRKPTRQDTVILNNEASAPSGKMKRDKSYHRGSASVKTTLEEEDTVIIPNLNTEFTLPVSSMPKFSFATPASQPKQVKATTSSADSPVKQALNFTFSSPIIEPVPSNKPASPPKYGGFQFSSPISVEKKTESAEPTLFSKPFVATTTSFGSSSAQAFTFSSPATKSNMDMSFSTAPKPKPKVNGPVEGSGGGFQVAPQLKQGSVMDILGGGSAAKTSTPSSLSSTPSFTAPPLSQIFKKTGWSCDVCLVNNKEDDSKCLACQTPKPGGQKPTGTSQVSSAPPLSQIFKKTGWSCDVCLVSNKEADIKCVACQTPKPGGQKPTGSATSTSLPLVSSIQPGNWICNICLIQNKKDDTICGACKAAKSTSKPSELKKTDTLMAKFKPPAGSWECEVCLVQNKSDDNKCVACQTPKPFKFFKHPPGDWTCDTCLVNNKASAVNCAACNYARPGPPRTQAVPSIAKSYTVSQASGFNLPSTESGGGPISSTGFKIPLPTSDSSTGSGFDVSKIKPSVNTTSADSKSSGGFKINSDLKSETSSGSGFKFGTSTVSESDKTSVSFGGIKVNTVTPSGDKPSSGFQFGNVDKKQENVDGPVKSAGFQFGKSDSSVSSNKTSSASEQVTASVGFVFGQQTLPTCTNSDINTSTSVPGGFTFKPSDSITSSSIKTNATETVTNTSKGIGGFNFTSLNSNSVATTSSSSSLGNFAFTATKVTDSSVLSGTSNQLNASKPAIGEFTFSQKPAESNTSSSPFTFAQNSTSVTSPTKRGRDDDTGEPALKKSFGQAATTSTPFQFGANSVATTSSSNSSTPFAFGQKTATTLANAGLFAFGQQNSTPSTVSQPVFGLQNSTSASSALPSVFGQQNSTVVSTSSASSTFGVFGGPSAAPVANSTPSLPVFGQTNSISAVTTTASSTPSLFQFGQANKTTASTPFNFATQSSGPTPVFGNGSFNFTAKKTESSTSGSSSELFKFGGSAPTQPVPATTPAFGSSSAFGSNSTPAFGSGSGSTVAFSGNAPSTTPAFGATPPAFGSSNSNTGQAAPAFGGNVSCMNVPVVSTCLSTALNVSLLSTCTLSSVISSCLNTSTVSIYSTDKLSFRSSYSNPSYVIANNTTRNSAETGNQQYDSCNVKINSSKLSLSAACSQSRESSGDSFFNDNCFANKVEDEQVETVSNDMPVHKATIECKKEVPKNTKEVTVEGSRCQDAAKEVVETNKLVDEFCQTDETDIGNIKTRGTESFQRNITSVMLPSCTSNSQSKGVQTESSDLSEIKISTCAKNVTPIMEISENHHIKNTKETSGIAKEHSNVNNTSIESVKCLVTLPKSTSIGIPKTGAANEPLTCGKLFVVPCFAGCLDNSVRLATAITKPLMSSRLSLPTTRDFPFSSKGSVNNKYMPIPSANTQSQKVGFGMSSPYKFSMNGDASLQGSSLNSPLLGSLNSPIRTGTSSIFGNMSAPMSSSLTFGNVNLSINSVTSTMMSDLNSLSSATTSVMYGYTSFPGNTSSVLGAWSLPISSAASTMFGKTSFPSSSSQIFGNLNVQTSSAISKTLCSICLPSSSLFSPFIANLNSPSISVSTSALNNDCLPNSEDKSVFFGNKSSPKFNNMNMESSSIKFWSSIDADFSSPMKKGTMDNKTGFIFNIPFVQGNSCQETKGSHSEPETLPSSQSTSSSTSSLFVFGGNTKTSGNQFTPLPCKPIKFGQDTKVFGNERHIGNAGASTSGLFVFGSSSKSDRPFASSSRSKSPTFFSRKSAFNSSKRKFVFNDRFSNNVVSETNGVNTKDVSSINDGTGVFSFQGPAVLSDVVMEDGSLDSTTNYSSGSEIPVGEDGTSRKVQFALSPPIVPKNDNCNNDQLNDNKVGKSILKTKINEIRSALHSATIFGEEMKEQSGNSHCTGEVDKLPSDSCIIGGKSMDTQKIVCNSKSMPFTSDFMMKEEHGELSMDVSVATKHDQKSVHLNNGNLMQDGKISQNAMLSRNSGNNLNSSQESDKISEDVQKSPRCVKKTVNFGVDHSGSSFSSNHFTFGSKSTSESRKSPPPNYPRNFKNFENCHETSPAPTVSVCSRTFSPVSPNVFVFSSALPQSKKTAEVPSVKFKKRASMKNKSKPSLVTAFSGKVMDKKASFGENEPSPKSSESSQSASGSDSSANSSSSSDSDHSVSTSSSSSSSTSANSDDDCVDFDSQPMEDDTGVGHHSTKDTEFSGLGNRSWNACPLEENSAEFKEEELRSWTSKLHLFEFSVCMNIFKLSQSVNSRKPAVFERWHALRKSSLDHFMFCPRTLSGVFGNTSQPAAPAQSSSLFQFGAKPAETTPAAVAFNFSASANPAGLGAGGTSFNFSAQAAPVNAFSATGGPSDGRKIKKAVRKIRR